MAEKVNLEIGSSYKFSTVAPSILGSEYKNMVLLSMMSSGEAVQFIDVHGIHAQIQQLPGICVPCRATDLHYLKFRTPNNNFVYIAQEYITGIQLISNKSLVITINNYTASDFIIIQEALRKLGFENFKCELIEK